MVEAALAPLHVKGGSPCEYPHRDILGASFDNDIDISIKQSNHKKGPMVEPWPGPKNSLSLVLLYNSSEMPYRLRIRW
jgi:hypothetical protein